MNNDKGLDSSNLNNSNQPLSMNNKEGSYYHAKMKIRAV